MNNELKNKIQNQKFIKNMVQSASPLNLILILFEGASQWLIMAKQEIDKNAQMQAANWTNFSHNINMAIDILSHLQECLDPKHAPELAERSFALYDFLKDKLFQVKISHNKSDIDLVIKFLRDLKSHWQAIQS
jgi:flagellar secretion chaperone FliS